MSQFGSERELAAAIAREAGIVVREIWSQDFDVVDKDGGKGPLTEADLAANRILVDRIRARFPDDAILSEEMTDTAARLSNPRCWIIDPLDGTREFTLKIPEFCVSVGFVHEGRAVAGALYNPATEELIDAEVGVGTAMNGQPVTVTDHATLDGARFLVSRSEFEKGWFADLEGRCDLVPMGSVAWKFGLVAAGRAEASFTPKPRNEWDLCGGVAAILAAGGKTTNGAGVDYTFNREDPLHIGVCGTNGAVHEEVLGLIRALA